ncbi:MAG TPA: hypothetical protein VFB42_06905 [Gaiellaceae bacterium]|nr:hypothetical protein [Gaiellaceae bacterium]
MSILVVHLVPEGILFGADRNITVTRSGGGVALRGQTQRPKVLRWPNRQVIVGYVGDAEIDGRATDEWLYDFIGRHIDPTEDLATLAAALQSDLNAALQAGNLTDICILHLAGFEMDSGEWTPRIWFIRNSTAITPQGAYVQGAAFDASEEVAQPVYFGGMTGNQIQADLVARGKQWSPFSFRQGFDLGAFNVLDATLRAAMRAIVETHPLKKHPFPTDLDEWTKHVRFAVLAYGSYFAAFFAPFEQYVGGGVDVVSVPWPGP